MSVRRAARLCTLLVLGSISLALIGCAFSAGPIAEGGNTTTGGVAPGSPAAKGVLGGRVYGAQSPVTNAAVTLWAAGTTGSYGTGATVVATTTTDPVNGTFSFNTSPGVSPCTTGQLLYITSVGGNTGGGTNQYAALMAALPSACSAATGNTFVIVNEVTTVASVTALQQFMSITPGGSPAWTIGAPAANATGLTNAFTQVGNLVNIATGTSGVTTATNTISSVTYTTTITPDTNKIYALADVLAACINAAGSSTCTSMFSDATPSGSTTPTDTIQVAYYLATNPAGLTMPAHGTAGSPSWLCANYATTQPPFPATSPSCNDTTTGTPYPTDWAIEVSWSASNGTSPTLTQNTYSLAIDGLGNVWTAYGVTGGSTTNPANLTEFNQAGQVRFTPVNSTVITSGPTVQDAGGSITTYPAPNFTSTLTGGADPTASVLASRVASLAIDTNNNAWFTGYYSTVPATSGALQGFLTEVTQTGTSSGFLIPADSPGAITIDGNNNIYLDDEPVSGRYYTSELEFSNSSHPGTYAVYDEGIDRQTGISNVVWADPLGYAWAVSTKCTGSSITLYRANTAEFESSGTTGDLNGVAATCPLYTGFPDATGGAFYADGSLYDVAVTGVSGSYTGAVTTEAAGTGTTNGGLDGGEGTFVDGLGNVWVANSVGGVSEFSFTGGAFSPLSPSGTATYGFGTSYLTGKNPYLVAGDSSGNIWIGSADSALHYLVGIAGPALTPTSAMLGGRLCRRATGRYIASDSEPDAYLQHSGTGHAAVDCNADECWDGQRKRRHHLDRRRQPEQLHDKQQDLRNNFGHWYKLHNHGSVRIECSRGILRDSECGEQCSRQSDGCTNG